MNKRRTYKHTAKYLQKKAEKEQRRVNALAQRRLEKKVELDIKRGLITPLYLILVHMEAMYGISEIEMLFGSNDAFLQKRIMVARAYLREMYEKGRNPTSQGLEDYFQDYAIEEYCRAIQVDSDIYNSLCGNVNKIEFIQRAEKYTYEFAEINDNLKKSAKYTKEEMINVAQKNYEELLKIDLRKGSTERRNSKRFYIVKLILQHLNELEEGTLSIRKMAKDNYVNRDRLGKYYNAIKTMLKLGMKIDEHSFDEKKRGRKAKDNPTISDEILKNLEKDLEDLPSKCGLNYASWTGEAIQDYLKIFHGLEVSLPFLRKYLNEHKIVSKSAARKNPNANPNDITEFKRTIYGKFKRAIKNNETVIFLDETHVQQGSRTRGYAKKGKDAVYSYHTENLHCEYTLITLIGFNFVMIFKHKGTMKSENYVNYLEQLHNKYPDQKFLIFRDNARIHTSEEVGVKLEKLGIDKYLKFESIPPYCPELNPVELMNNEFKASLKKYECQNKKEVSDNTDKFIDKFQDAEKQSRKYGRRKARQYFKGNKCSFIYNEYVRAMKDVRKEILAANRSSCLSKIAA